MEEINEDVSYLTTYLILTTYWAGVQMAMQSMEKELYATNSSQDDTLDECVSAKEKTMTKVN